jgi:hypothetical protein
VASNIWPTLGYGDIAKFCSGIKPGLGLIFRCLKVAR